MPRTARFEFLEHLAFADQELEVFGLAAGKVSPSILPSKSTSRGRRPRGAFGRALGEGAALLAQDVHGLVDGGVVHLGGQRSTSAVDRSPIFTSG
jgi:hypothetical protein